jgi:hypothetical protein
MSRIIQTLDSLPAPVHGGGRSAFALVANAMHIITSLMLLLLASFFVGCDIRHPDFSTKIAGDYHIHRTSAHQIMIAPRSWSDETPVIPTKVVECDFDSRYIIARQQELQRRNLNPSDTYMEPAPGKFHYWILDVRHPRVYGPLTPDEFAAQRKELGVPESLVLKDVYSFRR